MMGRDATGDTMGTRWRGGFTARRSGRGWGAAPSDETDRATISADRPANAPLYGRDRGGMLGDYAADYAVRAVLTVSNPIIYRIVCRRIAGYKPTMARSVHQRAPCTRRRARNQKADLQRGHPQPRIDHLRAGFTRDIICLPDRRAHPYRGKPKGKSGTEKKPNQYFQSESAFWKFFYTHG